MKRYKCINCSSKKYLKLFSEGLYNIYKCKKCRLLQTFPWPEKIHFNGYYDSEDAIAYITSVNLQVNFASKFIPIAYVLKKYTKLINSFRINTVCYYQKHGNILDIGCASGEFLNQLDKKYWNLNGIEANPAIAKSAQKKLKKASITCGTIEKAKLKKDQFDVITFWHVLEHLKNPYFVLKKINKSIKKHGFLIIEVPNSDSIYFKLFKTNWQSLLLPEHLYFWSKDILSQLLIRSGFVIVNIKFDGVFAFGGSSTIANYLRSKNISSSLSIIIAIILFPATILLNIIS